MSFSNSLPENNLIIVTDASKLFWASVIGQENEVGSDEMHLNKLNFNPVVFEWIL